MARALNLPDEEKKAIASAICGLVSQGKHLSDVLAAIGIDQATWYDWREKSQEFAHAYARAQQSYAESLVLDCPKIAEDKSIGPKERRVIIDTRLRIAALIDPRRFSQAAVDRLAAPPPEEESTRSAVEIAAAIRAAYRVANRLPAPEAPIEEAEFTETDE